MKRSILIGLVVLCVSFLHELAAQNRGGGLGKFTKSKRYWSAGISANTLNYFGDITPRNRRGSFDLDYTRPNLGVVVTKRYWPRVSVRYSASWGRIAGDDHTTNDPEDIEFGGKFRYQRNLHFRNDIYELAAVAIIDFKQNRGMSYRRPDGLIPYALLGVGGFYHNPQAIRPDGFEGPTWVNLRPLRTENQEQAYSNFSISFPVGLGVRYRLSEKVDLALEIGYRFTLTDYLDDVSGDYVDLGLFSNDLARALHDRSAERVALFSGADRNPQTITYVSQVDGRTYEVVNGYGMPNNKRGSADKDAFVVTGFHITYIFGNTGAARYK